MFCDLVGGTGERMWEAELSRLKGRLTLEQLRVRGSEFGVTNSNPQPPTPKQRPKHASSRPSRLPAGSKRSRWSCGLSLARLWQQQGQRAETRQMLADIYGWFTEGSDTKDLQEAKALLEELT